MLNNEAVHTQGSDESNSTHFFRTLAIRLEPSIKAVSFNVQVAWDLTLKA